MKFNQLFKQLNEGSARDFIGMRSQEYITDHNYQSEVAEIFDDAYREWDRGRGSSNSTFESWLIKNPIGQKYFVKITKLVKRNN